MKPYRPNTLRAAEEAVNGLIEECRKNGPLYPRCPKTVAQVCRTGRWLLHAIATLHRELKKPTGPLDQAAG